MGGSTRVVSPFWEVFAAGEFQRRERGNIEQKFEKMRPCSRYQKLPCHDLLFKRLGSVLRNYVKLPTPDNSLILSIQIRPDKLSHPSSIQIRIYRSDAIAASRQRFVLGGCIKRGRPGCCTVPGATPPPLLLLSVHGRAGSMGREM